MSFLKTDLKLGSLNIEGNANYKCQTEDLQKIIKNHDIFVILETWLDSSDNCPTVAGYSTFRSERKRKI